MSGEGTVVEFLPDDSGQIARLVQAAAFLSARVGDRIVLIGGLAVACRLGTVHRATQDVDAVTESSPGEPDLVEMLISEGGAVPADKAHRIMVGGVKVEVIETEPLPDSVDDLGFEPRLFVLAHRWGLVSATAMTIRVTSTTAAASLRVAVEASLVAMKLHAAIDRVDDAKRATDIYDIYRLLRNDRDRRVARSFASAPHDLAAMVEDALRRFFDDEAERSARRLLVHGGADARQITAQDLRSAVVPFVTELSALRG